jgi:hypothetical protein
MHDNVAIAPLEVPPSSCGTTYVTISKRTQRRFFTSTEDAFLTQLVTQFGPNAWRFIAAQIPGRSTRQWRDRYFTYLCPTVRTAPWTAGEDAILRQTVGIVGPRWALISRSFQGRSANAIKNRWYIHLKAGDYAPESVFPVLATGNVPEESQNEPESGPGKFLFPQSRAYRSWRGSRQEEVIRKPASRG